MTRLPVLVLLACILLPASAGAEVTAAGRSGFVLRIETLNQASPALSYEAFTAVERWWDPAHSYSRKSGNLSLSVTPGGAFLETLDNGGFVKHMEVIYANPGVEMRLLGGLGPLQPMGMHGVMTVQFEAFGTGSKTVVTYTVAGYSAQGLQELAGVVDKVLAGQMQRHAAFADILRLEREEAAN